MTETRKQLAAGVACALAGACLWGLSGTCAQFLYQHASVSPLFLTFVRMLGAAVLFLVVIPRSHRDRLREALSPRNRWRMVLFGFGLYLCQLTYLAAIGFTNAGTATVLQCLNVVIVMVVVCVSTKRPPYLKEVLALVLALSAVVLIATKGDLGTLVVPPVGIFWGLAAAATAAFYTVYPKKLLSEFGSTLPTGLAMLFGGLIALAVWAVAMVAGGNAALAAHPDPTMLDQTAQVLLNGLLPHLDTAAVSALVFMTVVGTFMTFGLFLHGIELIGSVRGSLLGNAEPVSATVFSAVLLGTAFVWADWLGMALMIGAVVLISLPRRS